MVGTVLAFNSLFEMRRRNVAHAAEGTGFQFSI